MILTAEEIKEIKNYLSNVPERSWFGKSGLTPTEVDLFDTIESQQQTIERQRKALEQAKTLLDRLITPGPAVFDSEIRTVLKQIAEVEGNV